MATSPPAHAAARPSPARLLVPAAAGAAVAVALGVYGRQHRPGRIPYDLGFSALFPMKVWIATAAGLLALLQLVSALWMYRRLPLGPAPRWVPVAHRVTGTVAFLLTLPVAYACLYALGFQDSSPRVLAHSLLGCAFYGAFVTKLLVLRAARLPRWALPAAGALLLTALVAVVLTSAGWTFAESGSPGF